MERENNNSEYKDISMETALKGMSPEQLERNKQAAISMKNNFEGMF